MKKIVPQYEPLIKRQYAKAVYRTIMEGRLGCCGGVTQLEEMVKEDTGAKYALATTSGTSAIMLALWAMGLKPGSLVLFPDYTFLAGANAARVLGHHVRLVDVKPDTLCMDPELVEAELKLGMVGAVIFVNHNGYVGRDLCRIKGMCDEYRIPMIEDSSQGMFIHPAGRTGDIGIFSFSVPKIVTGGQGGMLITDNGHLMEMARRFHDQGGNWRQIRMHNHIGVNGKYTDMQAAYVMAQLEDSNDLIFRKEQILRWYKKYIPLVDFGQPLVAFAVYRTKKLMWVQDALKQAGFQSIAYYKPVHQNPPYLTEAKFPVATRLHEELLYLPSSLNLTERQVAKICKTILKTEEKA